MKKILLLIFFLLLIPKIIRADTCSPNNYTAIFVNGIFTSQQSYADLDRKLLSNLYQERTGKTNVTFLTGFNPSHGSGAIDVIESATQMYAGGYLDHDLTDILRQIHGDLKTQKVILVGHSQGTFYTNAAYDYLVAHGVNKNSIAVYNVATPADRVAGDGKYLTSSTDEVINSIVRNLTTAASAKKPLPANINIKIPNEKGVDYEGGHSFSQVYLGLAPDKIIGDIDEAINGLTAGEDKENCFVQPEIDALYRVFDEGYLLADDVGKYSNYAATMPYGPNQLISISNTVFKYLYDFGKGIVFNVSQVLAQGKLLGASLLIPNNPPSAPKAVVSEPPPPVVPPAEPANNEVVPPPESRQDQIDDMLDELDLINQRLQVLIAQENQDKKPDDANKKDDTNKNKKPPQTQNTYTNYPKILISEVQVAPVAQRFVELFNPNESAISLTGWYLQRKDSNDTAWGSLVSSTNFSGKIIPANGYFLISREFVGSDILSGITLSNNNVLALKNPNEEISDKVGFGNAIESETAPTSNPNLVQSIGRKVLTAGTEQDTDNNLADFELDTPTPKAQNVTYVAPPPEPPTTPTVASITTYNVSNSTISPNGDLVDDTTNIDLAFSEDVKVTLDIVDSAGVLVKNIYTSDKVKNPATKIWNGRNNAGDLVPNGVYTIKVAFNAFDDTTGNLITDTTQTITVNVPPVILSNDASVTSAVYTISPLVNGAGTIKGVSYMTSKTSFLANLIYATGASLDNSSNFSNPVSTGNKLVVVAQDGTTKATYTITVDTTNWAQGVVDHLSGPNFVFHFNDFLPNQGAACRFNLKIFRDVYPGKKNEQGVGSGGCSGYYAPYNLNMSNSTVPGEYVFYVSYCGGNSCSLNSDDDPVGDYYRLIFDGTNWNSVAVDPTKTRLSNDVAVTASNTYIISEITSATYASGVFTGGTATIKNVRSATPKATFVTAFTPVPGATIDYSNLSDPVKDGDTFTATAENGIAKVVYKVIVDPITWVPGVFASYTPAGKFALDTSFFSSNPGLGCNIFLYKSLYPSWSNALGVMGFPCNAVGSTTPVYNLDMTYITAPGDYAFWAADSSINYGHYYEAHFDGATWTAISGMYLSAVTNITSTTYTITGPTAGIGTITNVPANTSKANFEAGLTKSESHQSWNDSSISDPVATGDKLVVTAQNGTTIATYTIAVNTPPDTTPPSIISYTLSNSTISPNGDGTADTTNIDLKFSEQVKVDIDIVDATGTKIKDLYNSNAVTNPQTKTWDGKNNAGAVVTDGIYTIKIVITDPAGNSITDTSKTIAVCIPIILQEIIDTPPVQDTPPDVTPPPEDSTPPDDASPDVVVSS